MLIAAAPSIVDGARKLWDAVRKQEAPRVRGQGQVADQRALEEQVAELRRELTAASELVTRLAEQNTRLVEAVEVLRVRIRLLLFAAAVTLVALVLIVALK
ncbi:hypothetical protein D3C83_05660 [compost metagenome]